MNTIKKLGVWMDHAHAHLSEYTSDVTEPRTIESRFTEEERIKSLEHGESTMQNKQQHQRSEYYKKLAEEIRHYDEVLLFGPTGAKLELFNILIGDHRFAKVKLEVKHADKMTDNQQLAFIREYFSTHLVA
jgi:hypothetical protein